MNKPERRKQHLAVFALSVLPMLGFVSGANAEIKFDNNCGETMSVRLYDQHDIAVTVPKWEALNLKNKKHATVTAALDGDKHYKAHVSGNCSAHIQKVCLGKAGVNLCVNGKADVGNWSCTKGGKASVWVNYLSHSSGTIKMC